MTLWICVCVRTWACEYQRAELHAALHAQWYFTWSLAARWITVVKNRVTPVIKYTHTKLISMKEMNSWRWAGFRQNAEFLSFTAVWEWEKEAGRRFRNKWQLVMLCVVITHRMDTALQSHNSFIFFYIPKNWFNVWDNCFFFLFSCKLQHLLHLLSRETANHMG